MHDSPRTKYAEEYFWHRPDLKQSLENLVFKTVLGEFSPEDPLAIYLNLETLREAGIYPQVEAHEMTHLHLTTSTTLGHALMFLVSGFKDLEGFGTLYRALMLSSWEAQEGAATIAEWCVAESNRPELTLPMFLASLPEDYKQAFALFNSIAQVLLPPNCYFFKPHLANALAQFALNTEIMTKLQMMISGSCSSDEINEFLNSTSGHPQKRLRAVLQELDEPLSDHRNRRILQLYDRIREFQEVVARMLPKLLHQEEISSVQLTAEQMQFNDLLNQVFLRYFVDITGLPISAYHASEAGVQFDVLAEVWRKKSGATSHRTDTTGNLAQRLAFRPTVRPL